MSTSLPGTADLKALGTKAAALDSSRMVPKTPPHRRDIPLERKQGRRGVSRVNRSGEEAEAGLPRLTLNTPKDSRMRVTDDTKVHDNRQEVVLIMEEVS